MTERTEDLNEAAKAPLAHARREAPSSLPPGWARATLGDLVSTKSGNSKLIKGKLAASPSDGLVPAYSASGQDVWTTAAEWRADGIVLSAVGARCGKTFLARGYWTAIANTHVLIPKTGVDPEWLWYLTNDESFWVKGGTAQPFVKIRASKSIPVLLPPLEDQRRIAAVLDAVEKLRTKRRQTLAKIDELTQAVFHDIFGDPVQDEHGWPTVLLGDVAQFVRGITFKPKDVVSAGDPGSVVCLRTKNVQADVDLDDLIAVAPTFVKRQEQYLQAGDILISSANSWNLVGKCCWIPELPWRASFGGFVTALRPTTESVHRRYLFEWLRHQRIQQLLRSFGRKTTNISNLNLDRCRSMAFPLPPVESQRQFVDAVERIQLHRTALEESSLTLDTLFASLQQRAFRGEL